MSTQPIPPAECPPGKYHVEITPADIASGKPGSPWSCAAALGIARAVGLRPEYGELDVDRFGISLHTRGEWRRNSRPLPAGLKRFIADFDAGRRVGPTRFKLVIVV